MKFRNKLSTALFLFLLSSNISAQTIEKPKVVAINPGHFPNDKLGGTGTAGKDATEYRLNLKTAQYIQEEFSYDPRFKILVTKNEESFDNSLIESIFNSSAINRIKQRMKHKTPKVHGFKPKGNPNPTPSWILRNLYSTRLTLEDETDAEMTISIHYDWSAKDDSGHSVILSPYSSAYFESKNLALCLSEELSKEQNISTQENAPNDSIPDFPKYMQKDRMELKKSGIRFRKLLPEIGNYQLPAKKPAIIVEYNFARKVSIRNDKYFKKMANATYRAILKYYNLNPLVNLNDQFEIILKNSKTGYIVKPEQNRISDFVMREIFSGMKK